jgi:hypothetical protein
MGAVAVSYPPEFRDAMKRLMGLKFAPSELTTHWEALRDLTAVELDAAVARAQKESDEFPSPRMLRAFVDEFRARQLVSEEDQSRAIPVEPTTFEVPHVGLTIPITREWRYYCDECSDTGVRSFCCGAGESSRWPWMRVERCARRKAHADHEWVEPCPCAETNPDVQRKKARAQQVTRQRAVDR